MDPLQVLLFGGFQLRRGTESVAPIPSRAARSLLAFLVVNRGVPQPRELLATQRWPDLPASRARRRLSHTLWQIQDALGELPGGLPYLEVTTDTIAFDQSAPIWVDVEEFERRLERLRTRRAEGQTRPRDLPDLEAAVDLYRGDFLSGHYDDWVRAEQERLEQRYLEALTWLVGLAKSQGAYSDALVYARRLTNQDPLREDGHREVMRLSMLLGRASEAIRQYERCREVLSEELGTGPSTATTELYRRIVRQRDLGADADSSPEPSPFPDEIPLVGRDRERAAAVTVLERALSGRGGGVLVEADPGIGKTRLLSEIVDDALWRGFNVAQAACRGPEGGAPYATLQELLEVALTPLRVEQLRHRVQPVWLAEVAKLVPAVRRVVPRASGPTAVLGHDEAAQRMRDALVQAVTALADVDALLVVVDDLQWSDEESLDVLQVVAAEAPARRLVLLMGYRGDEARSRPTVWEAIRTVDQRIRPERLLLAPLDAFSTVELARIFGRGHAIDPAAATRLHKETGGNPLFVVETLRELAERQHLDALEGRDIDQLPLPRSIRELVTTRLDRLPAEARMVLDVAALGGDGIDVDTLTLAVELPRESVVDAVDVLVRRGLMRESGEAFALQHDQVRRVVSGALAEQAARALHRRLATALETTRPDTVERLAHHFAEADVVRKAVHYLQRAGQAAATVHAYASADAHYTRAAGLQRRQPTSLAARFELLAEHETVLDVLGDRERQRAVVDELARLSEGDTAREVEVGRRRALLRGHLGELRDAVGDAREAVAAAERLADPAVLGPALDALGAVLTWAGELAEAVPILTRAATLAPDAAVQARDRTMLATVLRELNRHDEAVGHLMAALTLAERHGELREEARALGVLGAVRMETGQAAESEALYRRAIDRCTAIGFRHGEAIDWVNLANVLYVGGTVQDALRAYARARELFRDLEDRRGEAMVSLNVGIVRHAVLGDDTSARRELGRAIRYFREVGDRRLVAKSLDALATVAIREGEWPSMRAAMDEAMAIADEFDDPVTMAELLHHRAEGALAQGDPDRALHDVDAALAVGLEHDLGDLVTQLRALAGEVLVALGRPDEAVEHTTLAAGALHPGVERGHLIRYRHHLALRAVGRQADADEAIREAARELEAALAGLDDDTRRRALALPEHQGIVAGVDGVGPGTTSLVVASAGAPLGRPLRTDDLVDVTVDVAVGPGVPDDPVERRRWMLERVVDQIADQGGTPTVRDLATVLGVSQATVRRDLHTLRDAGRPVPTRGYRAG